MFQQKHICGLMKVGMEKNGAPFEMIDVYNDMEECKGFVTELADKVFDKIYNQNR